MKNLLQFAAAGLTAALVPLAGCFEHSEAPERHVTAQGMTNALAQKATVHTVILCGERIDELSPQLAEMPELRELHLRDAWNFTSFAVLSKLKLTLLDLSGTDLQAFVPEIANISTLEKLYLADNNITTLPDSIANLKNLTYLNLDRCALTAMPNEMPATLKWIRLNNNKLTALPANWNTLNPQRIYLTGNALKQIPDCMKTWTNLTDLKIDGNPIDTFPAWLADLPKLRNLHLDNTRIAKLPDDLTPFKSLAWLSLRHCPLPDEEKTRIRQAFSDYRTHIAF